MLPYLSYATPANQPTPVAVKVISIAGICIASITLVVRLLLLFQEIYAIILGRRYVFSNVYRFYLFSSKVIFTCFAAFLLVTAIGCLRRREIARVCIVRYAISYLIALVADICLIVLTYCLLLGRYFTRPTVDRSVLFERIAGVSVPSIVGAVFACILPIFILVYMRKPAVRAVFA